MKKFWNLLRKLSPMAESGVTMLANMFDPQVLADMINAKLDKKIRAIPYAKRDTTLTGRPGDTITVPQFVWDGEAQDVAEGEEIPIRALGTKTAEYKVKMAGIGASVTDMAVLSGLGDPIGAAGDGVAKSILARTDNDAFAAMMEATTLYDANAEELVADKQLCYNSIMRALDKFEEEENSDKVMFVHPLQVTQLRLDPNFIDKNKYGGNVMMDGEIGMVGNARILPSKKVPMIGGCFYNPILKTNVDAESELEIPAITYYLKRDTNVEAERKTRKRLTEITGDQIYVVAMTNDSRIVLLKTVGAPLQVNAMYEHEYVYPGANAVLDTTGVKASLAKTGANAYSLNLAGAAPRMDDAAKAALGFDASTTHNAVVLVGVPSAPLKGFSATEVYFNGEAVSANDVRMVANEPYLVLVRGLRKDGGAITGASASFTLKYGASGTTVTYTWGYNGLTLAQ